MSVSSDSAPRSSAASVTSRSFAARAGGEQEFSTSYVHPELLNESTVPFAQASTATSNASTTVALDVSQ